MFMHLFIRPRKFKFISLKVSSYYKKRNDSGHSSTPGISILTAPLSLASPVSTAIMVLVQKATHKATNTVKIMGRKIALNRM